MEPSQTQLKVASQLLFDLRDVVRLPVSLGVIKIELIFLVLAKSEADCKTGIVFWKITNAIHCF